MSEQKVLCPWCGREMIASYQPPEDHTYRCLYCRTNSPVRSTPHEAWKAAIGRPLQKPLTLKELRSDGDAIVWEERRNPNSFVQACAGGLAIMCLSASRSEEANRLFKYNVVVRAWRTLPTDEERAAAPWEGTGDADL